MPTEEPVGQFVYFIQQGEDGPIKIGFTAKTPAFRLNLLQTGNPEELRLLGVIPGGDTWLEAKLHRRFAKLRIRGEWFRPEKALLRYVQMETSMWQPGMPAPDRSRTIGAKILRYANAHGLTISDIARQAEMSRQQAWVILSGNCSNPYMNSVMRLMKATGATPYKILSWIEDHEDD